MTNKGILGGDDCLPLGAPKQTQPAPAPAPRRAVPTSQQKFLSDEQGRLRTNGYVPKMTDTFKCACPMGVVHCPPMAAMDTRPGGITWVPDPL